METLAVLADIRFLKRVVEYGIIQIGRLLLGSSVDQLIRRPFDE